MEALATPLSFIGFRGKAVGNVELHLVLYVDAENNQPIKQPFLAPTMGQVSLSLFARHLQFWASCLPPVCVHYILRLNLVRSICHAIFSMSATIASIFFSVVL